MSKRSIQRAIWRNQQRSHSRNGHKGNPTVSRPEIQRMTYRTTFWKTADGKRRSKTELVPQDQVIPMEASRETQQPAQGQR